MGTVMEARLDWGVGGREPLVLPRDEGREPGIVAVVARVETWVEIKV
jgi:hypothetical protein